MSLSRLYFNIASSINFIYNQNKLTIMKAMKNESAKMQEMTFAEMKEINGGQWITVIIDGKKTTFWLQ